MLHLATPGDRLNRVTVLAAGVGLLALLGPSWLLLKANRLVAGEAVGAFALSGPYAYALLGVWALLLVVSFLRFPGRAWGLALLCTLVLTLALLLIGGGSSALLAASSDPERARVSLQGGVWLTLLALYIGFFGTLGEAPPYHRRRGGTRALMVLPGLALAVVLILTSFGSVGLAQELLSQGGDFTAEVLRHLALAGTSVLLACAIGVPAAIWAARREEAARIVLPTASFLQTIPSLALFGIMLLPLARLGREVTVGEALIFCAAGLVLTAVVLSLSRRVSGRARGLFTLLTLLIALLPVLLLTVMVAVVLNGVFVALFSLDLGALTFPGSLSAPLSSLGVRGIGTAPALIALTLYALLPIVRNTYTGLVEVPGAATEAGRGMGMSTGQILRRVELPLALPLIMEGVRASSVLTIGITTVAFLIGAGGLGTFIERGISQQVPDLILLGALPIIGLALLTDALLRGLGQLVTPRGLR